MQVWVVNFFFRKGRSCTIEFGCTAVFKTKEALLDYLEMFDYEMEQVRFETAIGYENLGEYYVRYYPLKDDRIFRGELQYIRELRA